eukprot:6035105-Pleurochrysis_carterae.AAC.1
MPPPLPPQLPSLPSGEREGSPLSPSGRSRYDLHQELTKRLSLRDVSELAGDVIWRKVPPADRPSAAHAKRTAS